MGKSMAVTAIIALIITTAHFLLKKHLLNLPLPAGMTVASLWTWFKTSMVSPVFLGVPICFSASCLLWVWVMNRTDMTTAYAMASIVYIFIFAAGHLFLGEAMTWLKVLGVVFIVAGILCVTR